MIESTISLSGPERNHPVIRKKAYPLVKMTKGSQTLRVLSLPKITATVAEQTTKAQILWVKTVPRVTSSLSDARSKATMPTSAISDANEKRMQSMRLSNDLAPAGLAMFRPRSNPLRQARSALDSELALLTEVAVCEPIQESEARQAIELAGHGRNAYRSDVLIKAQLLQPHANHVDWERADEGYAQRDRLSWIAPARSAIGLA